MTKKLKILGPYTPDHKGPYTAEHEGPGSGRMIKHMVIFCVTRAIIFLGALSVPAFRRERDYAMRTITTIERPLTQRQNDEVTAILADKRDAGGGAGAVREKSARDK